MFEPDKKITRTPYKGEVGNLERLLDELIGFTPGEATTLKGVKRQYAERMALIGQAKEEAPAEVVQQIVKIEESLSRLRHARVVQNQLDKGISDLEDNQKTNENITKVIEIIKVSGSKLQCKYKAEFMERTKDKPLMVNYAGVSTPIDKYLPC